MILLAFVFERLRVSVDVRQIQIRVELSQPGYNSVSIYSPRRLAWVCAEARTAGSGEAVVASTNMRSGVVTRV
jgi:hypothetical protein